MTYKIENITLDQLVEINNSMSNQIEVLTFDNKKLTNRIKFISGTADRYLKLCLAYHEEINRLRSENEELNNKLNVK